MSVPIPIRGPLAVPFRIFGITQSKMNPNICTICERAFRRVKKQRHVSATATILFANPQDNIQNGAPDGIALIDTANLSVIDALSYEGAMTQAVINGIGPVMADAQKIAAILLRREREETIFIGGQGLAGDAIALIIQMPGHHFRAVDRIAGF